MAMDIYSRAAELVSEKKKSLKDKDIFLSPEYHVFVQRKAANIISGSFYSLREEGYNISESEEDRLIGSLDTQIAFDKNNPDAAYTTGLTNNGTLIFLNAGCDLVQSYKDRMRKHYTVQGMLYHEVGHLLFTDFPTLNAWTDSLAKGVWFPCKPKRITTPEGMRLNAAMADPVRSSMLAHIAHSIQNAMEDGFIERELREMYPVRGTACLAAVNDQIIKQNPALDKALEEDSEFNAIMAQVLLYSKFETQKLGKYNGPLLDTLRKCVQILDEVNRERDPLKRAGGANELLCTLYPFIEKEVERQQQKQQQGQQGNQSQAGNGSGTPASGNGSSSDSNGDKNEKSDGKSQTQSGQTGSSSGNQSGEKSDNADGQSSGASTSGASGEPGEPTSGDGGNGADNSGTASDGNKPLDKSIADAIKKAVDDLEKSAGIRDDEKQTGKRRTSRAYNNPGNSANKDAVPTQQKSQSKEGSPSAPGGNGASASGDSALDAAKLDVDTIVNAIAKRAGESACEKERVAELNREFSSGSGADYGVTGDYNVIVRRAADVSENNVMAYDAVAGTICAISKDLQRSIARILKDRREGGKLRNLPFGRRFEVSSVVHNDGKYFSRRKLPIEMPKLGVGLLVDESGSTAGACITAARNAAFVIEDFCRNLDIPCIISGYTTGTGMGATILSYVEPNDIDNKDRYRLTGMTNRSGTPTKTAMLYMCKRMERLPVDSRLLIVITDGRSGDNYSLEKERPITRIIREAKRKGMLVVAAGIGPQREQVKSEFGENFIDISNLEEMPAQLVGIIKQNLWV